MGAYRSSPTDHRCHVWALMAVLATFLAIARPAFAADPLDTIQRVKTSVVAIGTYQRTRSPPFRFLGTGFVVSDGSVVATNAHVLPPVLDTENRESLAIAIPHLSGDATSTQATPVKTLLADHERDVALLRIDGPRLNPVALGASVPLREGQVLYFTGFPIGSVLGLMPATHRSMVSALTPLAIPLPNSAGLDPKTVRRLSAPERTVIQLDGTAYPGSSGSPLYDPQTGVVVGVVNSALVKGARESALSNPTGIAYAVPIKAYVDALGALK